jgi:putative transposase
MINRRCVQRLYKSQMGTNDLMINNMDKFNNKYRIPSARLLNWDYASAGAYFITICTKDRKHYFGECINGKMKISTIGLIVQGCWYDIPNHTSANIILDKFVVMPNHIHGILIIGESTVETLHATSSSKQINDIPSKQNNDINQDLLNNLDDLTNPNVYDDSKKNDFFRQISPKPGSVSRIIGSFKSACTKHINLVFPDEDFDWQERFWDNIIKTNDSFVNISNYITNNPSTWNGDKFFD